MKICRRIVSISAQNTAKISQTGRRLFPSTTTTTTTTAYMICLTGNLDPLRGYLAKDANRNTGWHILMLVSQSKRGDAVGERVAGRGEAKCGWVAYGQGKGANPAS